MRIGIDARFLTHPQPGGFKTYTENLIAGLASCDGENDYVLYLDRIPEPHIQLPRGRNFVTRIVPGSLPMVGMPWREQVTLARQARRDRLDLLHSPSQTAPLRLSCASVVTVHDMAWFLPRLFPTAPADWMPKRWLMKWYHYIVPQVAARNASAVLTVSHASKDSIVRHLGLAPERVTVTYEGANAIYRRIDDLQELAAVRRKYDLDDRVILAIGSTDIRKNLAALVRAYALLPADVRQQYQLAVVLAHSLLTSRLTALATGLGISGRVRFLHGVSTDELVLLYNAATLFVFPSLYEGFGLPLLEAMACGTPVVAANNSCIPEIVGDAAELFDAEETAAIAATIRRVLSNDTLRTTLTERGLQRAARFSWQQCGRETAAVYKRVRLQ